MSLRWGLGLLNNLRGALDVERTDGHIGEADRRQSLRVISESASMPADRLPQVRRSQLHIDGR